VSVARFGDLATRFCAQCGLPVEGTESLCAYCGANLSGVPARGERQLSRSDELTLALCPALTFFYVSARNLPLDKVAAELYVEHMLSRFDYTGSVLTSLAVQAFKADSSSMLTIACCHSPEDVLKEAGRILARQDATEKRRFVEAIVWLAETVAVVRPRRAGPSEAAIAQVRSWLEGRS
jgi:hypothetical protein